jgi:hypothetical protein
MFALLACFSRSRELESLTEKYKARLELDPSVATEEQVILESLAELGRQVDKSVTTDEVQCEIGSKIDEILNHVNEADALLRGDFAAIRTEIRTTREAVPQYIEMAKQQILDDIQQFSFRLNISLQGLVDSAATAHENWMTSSVEDLHEMMEFFLNSSLLFSVVFFVFVQVVVAQAILHVRELNRYWRQRADQKKTATGMEATSV